MSYLIYRNLAALNEMEKAEAERLFLDCCGSTSWARRMAESRPYKLVDDLFASAERIWDSLSRAEQFDAFSQPKVTDKELGSDYEDACDLYRTKFGFIFVLSNTDRSISEMASICKARLGNSVETELMIAVEEQKKITENGLRKLLEK